MRDNAQAIFQHLFKIRPGEFLLVQSFFLYYVCIGMFIVLSISVGDSLLLTKTSPPNAAPLYAEMHVAIAALSILLTYFYDSAMGLLSRKALIIGTQLLLLLSIQAFQSLLVSNVLPAGERVYFSLAVWVRVCGLILIMLFFSFAGDYFTAHTAKRLYGYIAGGLPVGIVFAGVLTRKLSAILPSENMLYLCMGFLASGIVFSLLISKQGRPIAHKDDTVHSQTTKSSLNRIVRQSYIHLVFLVVLTGMLCFVIIDTQMKLSARSHYPNSAELTAFFGHYYSYVGILEIVFQFLFVERLLRRSGIIRSLMILPCIHIVTSALFYSTGYGVLSQHMLFIIVTASVFQDVLSDSLILPSRELLFLPLFSGLRLRSQAIMSGIVIPAGQGIGGLLIMLLIKLEIPLPHYSALSFSFAAGCLALLLLLQPRYRNMLSSSLKNTKLDREPLRDLARVPQIEAVLHHMLRQKDTRFIELALKLLQYRPIHDFSFSSMSLVEDPRPEIEAKAIELLGSSGNTEHLRVIEQRLHSSSSLIRKATVLAICRIKQKTALPDIECWMESPDPIIRYAALIGCGQYGGQDGQLLLRPVLKKLIVARQHGKRRLGASLLRDIGDPAYAHFLEILLDDPDPTVRIVAIKACVSLQSPILLSHLLRLYHVAELRIYIAEVLEQMPEEYAPSIANAAQNFILDESARTLLLQALGSIGGRVAQKQLWDIFSGNNPLSIRVAAGNALWRIALREPLEKVSETALDTKLEELCRNIDDLIHASAEITDNGGMVQQLLHDQARLEIECLFQLLSLRYDVRQLEKVQYNFLGSGPAQQANALELLDDILPRRLAPRIGELLDAFLQKKRLHVSSLSPESLRDLMQKEHWLQLIMTYYRNGNASGPPTEKCSEFSKHLEKISFFKNVELFQEVPANYLLPLAEIAETIDLDCGEMLFVQGERGDAMYLIRRGAIDVQVQGILVNQITVGECIGEMAILDDTPRTASCIAQEETEVLKISAQHFQMIVKSQPSVALAVLRTFSKRLRWQIQQMMLAQRNLSSSNGCGSQSSTKSRQNSFAPESVIQGGHEDEKHALFDLFRKVAFVKNMSLFKDLPEGYFLPLARMARLKAFKKDELIFRQGDPGDAFYCICSGKIGIQIDGVEVSRLGIGNCFGEMSILDFFPRSASCLALKNSELLKLSASDFELLLRSQPSITLALLKILARKLRHQTRNTIQRQKLVKT